MPFRFTSYFILKVTTRKYSSSSFDVDFRIIDKLFGLFFSSRFVFRKNKETQPEDSKSVDNTT